MNLHNMYHNQKKRLYLYVYYNCTVKINNVIIKYYNYCIGLYEITVSINFDYSYKNNIFIV